MKTIILCSPNQYGYFTIYYNYAKYLSRDYKVICLCFDHGESKFEPHGNIKVIYIPLLKWKIKNVFNYYLGILKAYRAEQQAIIILKYYFFSSLLNLFISRKDLILDIRTGYISRFRLKTFLFNSIIKIETFPFKKVIILSDSLRERLSLAKRKIIIIPLASERIDYESKKFDELNLLYVGSLSSRNIHQTIEGLSLFIRQNTENYQVRYYIVGGGKIDEVAELKKTIHNLEMEGTVQYEGPVFGERIKEYFQKCNIGICYIPLIRDYDCQPATKTVEYMMAGMPVIATGTYENKKVITGWNGVLINDNPGSFEKGLGKLISMKDNFDSKRITESVKEYSFEYIIENKLKPLLVKE